MYLDMLREILARFKKQILLFVLVVLAIFAGFWAWNYFRYGTIEVTTDNSGNVVIISGVKNGGAENEEVFSQSAPGSLSVRVSPGEYIVSVQGKVLAVSKTVVAEARKTKSYKLNPPEVSAVEPVTGLNANDLYADASNLFFVNTDLGQLFYINKNNKINTIGGSAGIQQAEWSRAGTGIGQDENKQIYAIKNNQVKKLSPPKPVSGPVGVEFAISAGGKMFALIGPDVYSINSSGRFSKIHTTGATSPQLAANDGAIAIINLPDNDLDMNNSQAVDNPFVEVISLSGETAKKDIRGTSGTWSPDGNKLIVADYFGSSAIYDKSLNLLETLPNEKVREAYWIDNDTVLYSVNNKVWSYSIKTGQSHAAAQLGHGSTINSITVDGNKNYVYLAAASGSKNGLYRFGLKGQTVPDFITTLDVFLPVDLDSCHLSYVNYKRPPSIVMNVRSLAERNICKTQTEIELVQDGFDGGDFRYFFYVESIE